MITMKISNEDYFREMSRFFRNFPITILYTNDTMTIFVDHNKTFSITINYNNASDYINSFYNKKLKCFSYKLKTYVTIDFPSSYEELCIINDLNGN